MRDNLEIFSDISIPFRQHNQWQNLLRVIDQLLKKDYEPNLLRTLREQVAARRFDSLLEFATAHFHDVVNAEQPKLDAQVDLSGGQNGHESVATSANIVGLPEDILRLCKEFLECVAAIKEA